MDFLSKFKKVMSNDGTTIMHHPDGHVLHLNHSKLEPKLKDGLKGLPALAHDTGRKSIKGYNEGTPDGPIPEVETQPPGLPSMEEQIPTNKTPGLFQTYRASMDPAAVPTPETPLTAGAQSALVNQAGVVPQDPYQNLPGYEHLQNSLSLSQKAESKQGQQEYQAYKSAEEANLQALANSQIKLESKKKEIEDVTKDIQGNHINPQHYLENLGAGKKVLTAIGLLLGGIGSGGDPSKNPALNFLNDQINRDVDAQKAEQGKKVNLLHSLQQQYGDQMVAENMFRSIRAATVANQLGMAAAQSKNPQAKQRAEMAKFMFEQQAQQSLQQAHLRDMLSGNTQQQQQQQQQPGTFGESAAQPKGGIQELDPAQLVPHLVPKEHQKEVFTEIKQAQNAAKVKNELMSAFDDADKENTVLKTGAGFIRTPASISKMRAIALPLIHDLEGRVNEFEQKTLKELEPTPGDFPEKVAAKRQAFEAFINQKAAAPTAKGYGLDLNKFSSTKMEPALTQDQKFQEWAKNNPSNPKAKAVFKLGVPQ